MALVNTFEDVVCVTVLLFDTLEETVEALEEAKRVCELVRLCDSLVVLAVLERTICAFEVEEVTETMDIFDGLVAAIGSRVVLVEVLLKGELDR